MTILFLLMIDMIIKYYFKKLSNKYPKICKFLNDSMITTFLGIIMGFGLLYIVNGENEIKMLINAYEKLFLVVL